jgi:hypothetical protein
MLGAGRCSCPAPRECGGVTRASASALICNCWLSVLMPGPGVTRRLALRVHSAAGRVRGRTIPRCGNPRCAIASTIATPHAERQRVGGEADRLSTERKMELRPPLVERTWKTLRFLAGYVWQAGASMSDSHTATTFRAIARLR